MPKTTDRYLDNIDQLKDLFYECKAANVGHIVRIWILEELCRDMYSASMREHGKWNFTDREYFTAQMINLGLEPAEVDND